MNGVRLNAYRTVRASLDAPVLSTDESERLRDIAEGLLLTRAEDADDAERLRRDAALALSLLVGQRRLDEVRADRLWGAINDCGPNATTTSVRLRLGSAFAGSL